MLYVLMNQLQPLVVLTGPRLIAGVVRALLSIEALRADEFGILKNVVVKFVCRDGALTGATDAQVLLALLGSDTLSALKQTLQSHLRVLEERQLDPRVSATLKAIESDYHRRELMRLDALASRVRVSPSHLSRLVRQQTGQCLLEHIRRRRVQCATRSLQTLRVSLGELARNSGYKHQADFTREFRRLHGCTPTEYLKKGRAKG